MSLTFALLYETSHADKGTQKLCQFHGYPRLSPGIWGIVALVLYLELPFPIWKPK